jgi:hypothetical protein
MASFAVENESTESLDSMIVTEYAKLLQDEQPKIGSAVKNVISLVLARSLTASPSDIFRTTNVEISPNSALTCGRALLQGIQAYELVDHLTWGHKFPQDEEQTGEGRIDDIVRYKCVYRLRSMALSKGGKISQLFGRSYLKWTRAWPEIRSTIQLPSGVTQDELDLFLRTFELSLLGDLSTDKTTTGGVSASGETIGEEHKPAVEEMSGTLTRTSFSDSELIWAKNFNEVLQRRQLERKLQVADRSVDSDSKVGADENKDCQESGEFMSSGAAVVGETD